MEYNLTPDQLLFRDTTRDFLEKEAPLTKVRELAAGPVGFEPHWWRRGAELGWTSMLVAPALGGDSISGSGLSTGDRGRGNGQAGLARSAYPGERRGDGAVARVERRRPRRGRRGADGRRATAGWAVYEPGHGWDPAAITTTATRDGDGYVLAGVKDRVEAGDQADYLLVTARAAEGLRQFLVPASAPA